MPLRESEVIHFIQTRFPGGRDLMDDCGALPFFPGSGHCLVTTDLMEEGQHFRREWHPPAMLARKLLRVNLSDLDASGARPLGYTLTLAFDQDLPGAWLEAFLEALGEASHEHGIPVLGGDTVGRPRGLGLGMTAFGIAKRWLQRNGVQPGQSLWVDQPLGASLRGLRKLQAGERWNPQAPDADLLAHLEPRPNLGLGPLLAACSEITAAIDVSDGLSKDLRMLAEASEVSIVLEPGLPLEWIQGGEDYARCFATTLSQEALEAKFNRSFHRVGTALPRRDAPLLVPSGQDLVPLEDLSFNHFASQGAEAPDVRTEPAKS